jgi:rhodanese-related sulfurtransferase
MNSNSIKTLNVHELKNAMDANNCLCLIDVREPDEWQEMRIPGAINIPKDQLALEIKQLIKEKDHPIYLHCRGGVRSLYAAQSLSELGYHEVYSIDGGIIEWAIFGYPIEG